MATIPSISLIPSGYKAGKVYSVLPTDGSGDLDFARTTTATRINKNGLIENVGNNVPRLDYEDGGCPSLLLEPTSRNLITQSEAFGNSYWTKSGATIEGDASTSGSEKVVNGDFATDTDWNKGTGWTISGGSANSAGGNEDAYLAQSNMEIGKTYLVTFDVTAYTSGELSVRPFGDSQVLSVNSTGSYSLNLHPTNNTLIGFRSAGGAGGFVGSIDNVSVKEVQGFSAPSADTPLGAFKLVEGTNNGNHTITGGPLVVSSGGVTISLIIKANGRNWVKLAEPNLTGFYAYFDIANDVIGTTNSATGKIIDLGNGYKRISMSFTAAGNCSLQIRTAEADNDTSYTGDGTSGVYIFGAQLEVQSYATSYIPTKGSTQTRLKDSASKSGISSLINSSEGVLYAEMSGELSGTNRYISLSDGTTSNRISIFLDASNNLKGFVNGISSISGGVTITENFKCAFKYKSGDIAFWVNGVEVGTKTASLSLTGLDRISFDLTSGSNDFYGNVKQLQVFKTALTDLEIETLTSYTSFNAMALALNYKIQ